MSIIAVSGVPPRWNMKKLMINLVKVIKGKFEVLNITCKKKNARLSYLRLSERLDPKVTVEQINKAVFKNMKLHASIPHNVPELSLSKPMGIPNHMRRAMHIPNESTPGQVLFTGVEEILHEIQSKYTGLYDLSKKSDHKLLKNIAKIICDRLKEIIVTIPDADTCFKLTRHYRKIHPHFGDFQLILSTLHNLEDTEGRPRTQLNKQEFSTPNAQPHFIDNVPYNKVQQMCTKYSNSITKKITDHVNNLKTDIDIESNPEEAAHKRVRLELKKLVPYLSMIIKQVVTDNFVPQKPGFFKIKIYGEPFMPPKQVMMEFLKRHRALRAFRCERAYNLLRCKVAPSAITTLMASDGSVVGGATIYIRLAKMPYYKLPDSMKQEILVTFDKTKKSLAPEQMDEEVEWNENW